MQPKVSIIVPVYNVEPYICRLLDCFAHQGIDDYEVLLIDDGSPDRCGDSSFPIMHMCNPYNK